MKQAKCPYLVFLYRGIWYFGGFLDRGGIQRSFIGVGCLVGSGFFSYLVYVEFVTVVVLDAVDVVWYPSADPFAFSVWVFFVFGW